MKTIQEPMVFATYYGSRLYGTVGPNSDTDIRGVFIPAKRDLLLDKAPQHYNFKEEADTAYMSLHYFLQLLTQGETNCLDMFFSYSNKEAQISTSPMYEELILNKDKLITKNVAKYLGYCRAQALKYSIKGDRIQNLEVFLSILDKMDNQATVTLEQAIALNKELVPDSTVIMGQEPYVKNNKKIGIRRKLVGTPMGEHVYTVLMDNQERYVMVAGHLFPATANLSSTKQALGKCLSQYGRRAYNAASDNGADHKALSHALRVTYQAMELLSTGCITFPLRGEKLDLVRQVKFKTTTMKYEEIVEMIERNINDIETNYLPQTALRAHPDTGWIEDFILSIYEKEK